MWRLCPSAPLWSRVLCRAHLVPDKAETPELFVQLFHSKLITI